MIFAGQWPAEMVERRGDLFLLRFAGEQSVLDILEQAGQLPLPPYITHTPDEEDAKRYQTIYARDPGAVGWHRRLDCILPMHYWLKFARWACKPPVLTLHVGAGTFQPVRVESIAEHVMHHERYTIPTSTRDLIEATKAAGGKVIAVGTTSLRARSKAASQNGFLAELEGDTNIFMELPPGLPFPCG